MIFSSKKVSPKFNPLTLRSTHGRMQQAQDLTLEQLSFVEAHSTFIQDSTVNGDEITHNLELLRGEECIQALM